MFGDLPEKKPCRYLAQTPKIWPNLEMSLTLDNSRVILDSRAALWRVRSPVNEWQLGSGQSKPY